MSVTLLPQNIREAIDKKNLIFTVTTGRSGTNYMANMLSYLPNVYSKHEPNPAFHDLMRKTQTDPNEALRFWIAEKLPAIAQINARYYVETSHIFCKGFLESLLDLEIVPNIVILRRDPRTVAISLYQLNCIPARTKVGELFLLQPDDPGVLPLRNWEELHDYQLTYWYTLEIERRAKIYKNEISKRGGRVIETTLEEFSTLRGYYRFLNQMSLPWPTLINCMRHLRSHLRHINTKSDLKQEALSEDWDQLESEVMMRIPYDPFLPESQWKS